MPVSEPTLGPVAPIWVVQTFTGGRQCQPGSYTPPDVRVMLERVGVAVLETRVEPLSVCHACDICPAYSADHFVLIDPAHLDAAQAAGFARRED